VTHVVEHEAGATAALSGGQLRAVVPGKTTYPTAEDIKPRIRTAKDVHFPATGLIVLENALSDGTVMPIGEMKRVKKLAEQYGIKVHLDGARIFNAALALGVNASEIAAQADSVSVCLSKGLGAPIGSLLVGSRDFIDRARMRRKLMGGGMRQAGVLAAPGIIALREGIAQLPRDHANAKLLARHLSQIPGMVLDVDKVMTNMVFCQVDKPGFDSIGLVDFLAKKNIVTYPPAPPGSPPGIRFVTSREVDEKDVAALVEAVSEYLR
jgi:threonine aldolase